ncbi:MAG: hypothetical protein IJ464_03620 [Alistipes sp.]|nr:hypothetical protein [Alistipes sp.]
MMKFFKIIKRFFGWMVSGLTDGITMFKVMGFLVVEGAIIYCSAILPLPKYAVVLLSNLLTFVLVLMAAKTFKKFGAIFTSDDIAAAEKYRNLEREYQNLRGENHHLETQLQAARQAEERFKHIQLDAELIVMHNTQVGYVVMEDKLSTLKSNSRFSSLIPEEGFFDSLLRTIDVRDGDKKILYVDKAYHKSSIGIKFANIRYAKVKDQIYLSGVDLEVLHDTSGDLREYKSDSDVQRCWVYCENTDETSKIYNSDNYRALKTAYRKYQQDEALTAHHQRSVQLSRHFTQSLHSSLCSRYDNLHFISKDSEAYNRYDWRQLGDGNMGSDLIHIMSDMYMSLTIMDKANKDPKLLAQ